MASLEGGAGDRGVPHAYVQVCASCMFVILCACVLVIACVYVRAGVLVLLCLCWDVRSNERKRFLRDDVDLDFPSLKNKRSRALRLEINFCAACYIRIAALGHAYNQSLRCVRHICLFPWKCLESVSALRASFVSLCLQSVSTPSVSFLSLFFAVPTISLHGAFSLLCLQSIPTRRASLMSFFFLCFADNRSLCCMHDLCRFLSLVHDHIPATLPNKCIFGRICLSSAK